MNKSPTYVPVNYVDTDPEASHPLDRFEIEVHIAIAQHVIRRVAGTPQGKEIFDALMSKYEDRYPYHKLLAKYLTSPEHFETEQEEEVSVSLIPSSVLDKREES